MLTISQLARYAQVTVRTVRHYHRSGLLAEPERDHSGYRRYTGVDVVNLIRIRTLARAGVPLSRVGDLLEAEPDRFTAAITEIDHDLRNRIAELEQRRRDLAQLPSAERLSVPDEVADLLTEMREIGISERTIVMERESWILLAAAYPDLIDDALRWKRMTLASPVYRALMLRIDEAFHLDPDDPRLVTLAEETVDEMDRMYPPEQAFSNLPLDRDTYRMVSEHNMDLSPAWQRLDVLVNDLARARGYEIP